MNRTKPAVRVEIQHGQKAVLTMADIEDLVRWVLDEHGLTLSGWRFGWDRAIRRAGCCDHARMRITLSRPVFGIEDNREDVLDTILHEAAHALAGPAAGHGARWKAAAVSIGARPERCHSLAVPAPFVGLCKCASKHSKVRRPNPNAAYHCRRCSAPITWVEADNTNLGSLAGWSRSRRLEVP